MTFLFRLPNGTQFLVDCRLDRMHNPVVVLAPSDCTLPLGSLDRLFGSKLQRQLNGRWWNCAEPLVDSWDCGSAITAKRYIGTIAAAWFLSGLLRRA